MEARDGVSGAEPAKGGFANTISVILGCRDGVACAAVTLDGSGAEVTDGVLFAASSFAFLETRGLRGGLVAASAACLALSSAMAALVLLFLTGLDSPPSFLTFAPPGPAVEDLSAGRVG